MKIVTLHKPVDINRLYNHISQNLDPLFAKQRGEKMHFDVKKNGDAIDISQSDIYDEVLYHIEVKDDKLNIIRNEHYTDDVNSLTVESILNELFEDISGKLGTDLVQEG